MRVSSGIYGFLLFFAGWAAASADGPMANPVTGIEVLRGPVTLHGFDPDCHSIVLGELPHIKRIKLGDTIALKQYTFKVGLIDAAIAMTDGATDGKPLYKKGDLVCLVAERALPTQDSGCNRLWVRVPSCRQLP